MDDPTPDDAPRVSRRGLLVGGGIALIGAGLGGLALAARRWNGEDEEPGAAGWSELIAVDGVAPIHASVLPSGRVLMTGEDQARGGAPTFVIDPTSQEPIRVVPMDVPMRDIRDSLFCSGHAFMADGRLFFAGGSGHGGTGLRYGLVLQDGVTPQWTPIEQDVLGGFAWYPTLTRMADGSMLVLSGYVDFGLTQNRTIQSFDPASFDADRMPWTQLVPRSRTPEDVSATGSDYTHTFLLPRPIEIDGRPRDVAMIGWSGEVFFFNHADPFERPEDRFATRDGGARPGPTGPLPAYGASSALLADGRILITGGGQEHGADSLPLTDIYDPYQDTWRRIDMGIARSHPAAVLLPDTTVLVVNGNGGVDDPRRPQIVDPVTETVTTGPPWPDDSFRGYHNVAVLLPDARVLIAGGETAGSDTERSDLRYYSPPYLSVLSPSDRPRILAAPPAIGYGERVQLSVEGGPIDRVTLLALGSMTHAFDANQRCVALFDGESQDSREVSLVGPRDAHAAPPGDYMLFVLRRVETGGGETFVPSVARMVKVG